VAQAILKDPKDTTQIVLLFGNVTVDDILLKVCSGGRLLRCVLTPAALCADACCAVC
jgi:hypothetical protein